MRESSGNLFSRLGFVDAICFTTNGYVTKYGRAVMGRGTAQWVRDNVPESDAALGMLLRTRGNRTQAVTEWSGTVLVSFPVKPVDGKVGKVEDVVPHLQTHYGVGKVAPGFALKADLGLIARSAEQLRELTDLRGWQRVLLPRPGCANGGLSWEEVRPILVAHLDDRFEVVHLQRALPYT